MKTVLKPYYPNFRNIFDYIAWDDGHFQWDVYDVKEYDGFDFYTMNMTSQQWLTDVDVDRPIWWHTICIAVPHHMDEEMGNSGLLTIDGGFHDNDPLTGHPIYPESNINAAAMGKIAKDTGGIAANIYFVPNQRIKFMHEWDEKYIDKGRAEDQIIAYTWKRFIDTPNVGPQTDEPFWLVRFPMVKAAIKAMDAISQWNTEQGRNELNKWCITGASKRGWATWLTAGVDPRVNCIIPMVETFVGMKDILHGHYQALGGWSFAFEDYYREGLTQYLDTPQFELLCEHVDPISYAANLTMPKLVVQSTGDEFFLPTDTPYFYDLLPGKTYLRLMPNAEHSMILHGKSSPYLIWDHVYFYMAVNKNWTMPEINFKRTDTSTTIGIELSSDMPISLNDIEARNGETRGNGRLDYRLARLRTEEDPPPRPIFLDEIPDLEYLKIENLWWRPKKVTKRDNNTYYAAVPKNKDFYQGIFLQVTHQLGINDHTGLQLNFTQTTLMYHYPDNYSNPDCSNEECMGVLV